MKKESLFATLFTIQSISAIIAIAICVMIIIKFTKINVDLTDLSAFKGLPDGTKQAYKKTIPVIKERISYLKSKGKFGPGTELTNKIAYWPCLTHKELGYKSMKDVPDNLCDNVCIDINDCGKDEGCVNNECRKESELECTDDWDCIYDNVTAYKCDINDKVCKPVICKFDGSSNNIAPNTIPHPYTQDEKVKRTAEPLVYCEREGEYMNIVRGNLDPLNHKKLQTGVSSCLDDDKCDKNNTKESVGDLAKMIENNKILSKFLPFNVDSLVGKGNTYCHVNDKNISGYCVRPKTN